MKNPRTGEQIFTGWPRGSESFGDPRPELARYILDPPEPMRVGFFKYFLFHDPNWDFRTIDWERDLALRRAEAAVHGRGRSRLSAFKKSGGKLLMYTGWADPVVPPQDTVAYYDAVVEDDGRAGEDARVLPPVPRAWHGALQRRTGAEPVRSPDGARAVGACTRP